MAVAAAAAAAAAEVYRLRAAYTPHNTHKYTCTHTYTPGRWIHSSRSPSRTCWKLAPVCTSLHGQVPRVVGSVKGCDHRERVALFLRGRFVERHCKRLDQIPRCRVYPDADLLCRPRGQTARVNPDRTNRLVAENAVTVPRCIGRKLTRFSTVVLEQVGEKVTHKAAVATGEYVAARVGLLWGRQGEYAALVVARLEVHVVSTRGLPGDTDEDVRRHTQIPRSTDGAVVVCLELHVPTEERVLDEERSVVRKRHVTRRKDAILYVGGAAIGEILGGVETVDRVWQSVVDKGKQN